MTKPLSTVVGAVLWLTAAVSSAQVLSCTEDGLVEIADGRLLRAVLQLQEAFPTIRFQNDPTPCVHARETARAVSATVDIDPWQSLVGFEYVVVTHGSTFFTVDRLAIRDSRRREALAAALSHRRPPKLAIKANRVYRVQVVDNSLVLSVSPASGQSANAEMLARLSSLLSE